MKRNTQKGTKAKLDEKEPKSTFLSECKKSFGQTDFYLILGLNKAQASQSDSLFTFYNTFS